MKNSYSTYSVFALALGAPIVTASLALLSSAAIAQEDYPNKPISMVVPFPPGGVADTVGRPIAEAMTRILKQPIIVENKAGAGGGVGMGQVAKAKADGYTLLMALSSITILPEADKVLNRAPLYQLNQFKAIARFTADPTVLVVRADSPWKTFAEFIADVKKTPGKYTFGSSGNYGTMHAPLIPLWCMYPIPVPGPPY
jgi:tripartite-type tricarboxylate transporter receptor subunit TctC